MKRIIIAISLLFCSIGLYSQTCPQGVAYADGCSGAITDTPQLPHLQDFRQVIALSILGGSGYTNGTYTWTSTGGSCTTPASGTVTVTAGAVGGSYGGSYTISNEGIGCTSKPSVAIPGGAGAGSGATITPTFYNGVAPWNVAGVNYAVGVSSSITLADPTTAPPTGCTYASSFLTCTGANFNLSGFDFTLHNTNLNINASGNCTIANNKFVPNAASSGLWIVRVQNANTCNLTFQNNSIDGLSPIGGNPGGSGFSMNPTWILDSGGSGDITMLYNYCHNMDSKCTQISGSTLRTKTYTEKYNLFYAFGNCATSPGPCQHGEAEYTFTGTAGTNIILNESFNTYEVPFHNSPEDLTALQAIQGDTMNIIGGSIDHNINLAPGPQATCPAVGSPNVTPPQLSASANFYDGFQGGGNLTNVSFFNNYMDGSSVFFNWYHTNGTNLIFSNNIDAGGGGLCNGKSKTPPTTPVASPGAGSYGSTQSITLSNPSGAPVICWNTNTSPYSNGVSTCPNGNVYTGPITVSSSETLYWTAGGTGFDDSIQASATYVITPPAAQPTFFPLASTYGDAQAVTISSITAGAAIFFTTDGSAPSCSGNGLTYSNVAYVVVSSTLRAIACAVGFSPSPVASGAYTIIYGCGPPGLSTSQACFNTSTGVTPLVSPIPSWGSNPTPTGANAGNPYAVQLTGNLLGTGTSVTPSDYGMPIIRCTDANMFGGQLWGLVDNGGPTLISPDDSAFIAKANGGNRYIIAFNPITGYCVGVTGTGLPINNNVSWSHTNPQVLFTLSGPSSTIISTQTIVITCTPLPIAVGTTCTAVLGTLKQIYDFSNTSCIQNSYNGSPGWTLGSGSVGSFSDSADDTSFAVYYSDHNIAGQHGRWFVNWKLGYGTCATLTACNSIPCNIWDTNSGKYQSFLGVQKPISITPPSQALDTFTIHEGFSTLGNTYGTVTPPQQSAMITGTYYSQNYVWNYETGTVIHAGYPTPTAPTGGNSIIGSLTSGTCLTGDTFTQAGTGATTTIVTPSGGTPGFTTNGAVLQVGTIAGSPNTSGAWSSAHCVYTPLVSPAQLPQPNPTANYFFAGHYANGINFQISGKNANESLYTNPIVGNTTFTTPNGAPCNDSHFSWNFNLGADANPSLTTSQDYYSPANLATLQVAGSPSSCPPPGNLSFHGIPAYYDEYYYSNNGGSAVLHLAHTYNSGWEWSFDAQNSGVGMQSVRGRWVVGLSDGWGQYGNYINGNSSCNVGGFDWLKSDASDFVVGTGFGSYIMPQSNNNGNYIFHVKSCTGTCATGGVRPGFPQSVSAYATIVDNTITWETIPSNSNPAVNAVNDCRPELMLIKTYQPGSVTPVQTPAPTNLLAGIN